MLYIVVQLRSKYTLCRMTLAAEDAALSFKLFSVNVIIFGCLDVPPKFQAVTGGAFRGCLGLERVMLELKLCDY